MQFRDELNNTRIQIGRDKTGNFTFTLKGADGKTVLIDENGLHEDVIPDNIIKTNMISDGAITEDKIDKSEIREWKDKNGNKVFDVSKMYYGDDKFEVSYNSITENFNNLIGDVSKLNKITQTIELVET